MAESFAIKCGLLQNIIEKLQCFRCEDVPGPNGADMNRYNCFSHSHSLCEKCKNDCPCNSPVGKNPQPILQQLIKDLPWYCPNYKKVVAAFSMMQKCLKITICYASIPLHLTVGNLCIRCKITFLKKCVILVPPNRLYSLQ